jgi:4-hydroxy-tetrahydrodipicolinate synthase
MADGERFFGLYSVLPTPFDADGDLDLGALAGLVRFAARAGARGVTVLGVMGEAAKLTEGEREAVVRAAAEAAAEAGVDLVAGVSAAGERPALAQAQAARAAGAAAVMASPPPGTSPQAVVAFYARLSEAAGVPVVVQDLPTVSGVVLPAPLLAAVGAEVAGVAAIKLEDPPTPLKVSAILRRWGEARPAQVMGGLGGLFLLEELRRGASGTMTGFGYPEALAGVCRLAQAGDWEGARRLFERFLPVIRYENMPVVSVNVRKALLHARGVLPSPTVRRPAPDLDEEVRSEIDEYVRRYAGEALVVGEGEAV